MRSLCQLFTASRDLQTPVARRWDAAARADRALGWAEFRRDVAALCGRLDGEPEGAWILLTQDAYAFAVGLLALWHSGRHAISPPNRQPGTLRVLQTRAAGSVSDRPDWFPEGCCLHPVVPAGGPPSWRPRRLDRDAPAVELYTSGTTGAEKAVAKRIRHLDDEVSQLEATWASRVAGAGVFSTASHQHLYGLLFGVLWPLCAGRPFQAEHFLHVGEFAPRIRELGRSTLVSVPTHLKRLARYADLASLRGRCALVFSSGGPLASETAHHLARGLGRAPVEVLGSTETGGIAWRTQQPGQQASPWTPFASVCVSRDPHSGVARVRSPFVSAGEGDAGLATGDRIRLRPDGRFELEGRADRVVKVAEKRLDLSQMESQLRAHPWVAEVALATVERGGELRVAAAVVPTQQARRQLRREGRRALGAALTASLADGWDPVLHPRLWRLVERLPENPQGKLTRDALRQLFRGSGWDAAATDRLEVLQELRGDGFVEKFCRVPEDLSCFPGHFPGFPVVPGVLQLDWALELAAELLGETPRVAMLESLKLLRSLRPGDRFRIRVEADARARIDFRLWNGSDQHARGRVRLVAESEGEP